MNVWLGPASVAVTWITYALVYTDIDRGKHCTLSSAATSTLRNYWIFMVGLVTSGLLTFIFIQNWLITALQLPGNFLYIAGIATLVFQPVIAIVPTGNKWQKYIHTIAAYCECMLLPFMAIIIAQSKVLPVVVRLICWMLIGFMLYLTLEFRKNFLKPRFIWVQTMFTATFHSIMMLATTTVAIIK